MRKDYATQPAAAGMSLSAARVRSLGPGRSLNHMGVVGTFECAWTTVKEPEDYGSSSRDCATRSENAVPRKDYTSILLCWLSSLWYVLL